LKSYQIRKRYIVTPKDKAAAEFLNYDNATAIDLIELVLTEGQFNALNYYSIFSSLNEILGSNIDDFEDELITDDRQLEIGLSYLRAISKGRNCQKSNRKNNLFIRRSSIKKNRCILLLLSIKTIKKRYSLSF
jgi:hypothetical protein